MCQILSNVTEYLCQNFTLFFCLFNRVIPQIVKSRCQFMNSVEYCQFYGFCLYFLSLLCVGPDTQGSCKYSVSSFTSGSIS